MIATRDMCQRVIFGSCPLEPHASCTAVQLFSSMYWTRVVLRSNFTAWLRLSHRLCHVVHVGPAQPSCSMPNAPTCSGQYTPWIMWLCAQQKRKHSVIYPD